MTCNNNYQNTGEQSCKVQLDLVEKVLFWVDKTAAITGATEALMIADIKKQIQSSTKLNRLYVFPLFKGVEDTSEDLVTGTYGYGETAIVRDGKKAFNFQYQQDVELTKLLRSFNNVEGRIAFLCSNGDLIVENTTTGYQGFVGKPYFMQGGVPTGDDVRVSNCMINLTDAVAWEDRIKVLNLGLSPAEINGLTDVEIVKLAATKFQIFNNVTGENITSLFSTTLIKKEAWLVAGTKPAADSTYSSTDDAIVFAVAPTTSINLVNPALLYALTAPVEGIESTRALAIT